MLTVNHLAPYLPYGLKLQTTNLDVVELETLSRTSINIKGRTWVYGSYCDIEDVKPILRPMSDLEEQIDHDGYEFVPIEWLENRYDTLDIHEQAKRLIETINWVNQCDYMLIMHLIEWHFDVFGLIDQGLAISIHEIPKTEK